MRLIDIRSLKSKWKLVLNPENSKGVFDDSEIEKFEISRFGTTFQNDL